MTAAAALSTRSPEAEIAGSFVAQQLRIGVEYYTAGRNDEAIVALQGGLAAAENEAPGSVPVETISELHAKLGNACMVRGDLDTAAANYKAALRLAPHLTDCWCNFGNVHLKTGKPQDAISLYLQALKINPGHWPARTNLVQALMTTQQYIMAKALLIELVNERPQDGKIHHQLGKTNFELNDTGRRACMFSTGRRPRSA